MAIACLRLVTFLPERPLRSLPRFISCIDFSTLVCAFLPYLAMTSSVLASFIGQKSEQARHGPRWITHCFPARGHTACGSAGPPTSKPCVVAIPAWRGCGAKEHCNDCEHRDSHPCRSCLANAGSLRARRMQLHRPTGRTVLQRGLPRGASRRIMRLQSSRVCALGADALKAVRHHVIFRVPRRGRCARSRPTACKNYRPRCNSW